MTPAGEIDLNTSYQENNIYFEHVVYNFFFARHILNRKSRKFDSNFKMTKYAPYNIAHNMQELWTFIIYWSTNLTPEIKYMYMH